MDPVAHPSESIEAARLLKAEANVRAVAMYLIVLALCAIGLGLGMWAILGERAEAEFLEALVPGLLIGGVILVVGCGLWGFHGWARVAAVLVLVAGVGIGTYRLSSEEPPATPDPQQLLIKTVTTTVMAAWHAVCILVLLIGGAGRVSSPAYRRLVREQGASVRVPMFSSATFQGASIISLLMVLGLVASLVRLATALQERGLR